MTQPHPNSEAAHRTLQFRLRSLLLLTVMVAVVTAFAHSEYQRRRKQRMAAAPWEQIGATVTFDAQSRIIKLEFQPGANSIVCDSDLVEIVKLDHLIELDFGGYLGGRAAITDTGITHLRHLSKLESMNLDGTSVTGAGLSELQELSRLRFLFLGSTGITGRDLVHLKHLPNLRGLWLNHTKINDDDLELLKNHVASLSGLEILHLAATEITDNGLIHLEEMSHLDVLRVNGPGVSETAMRSLQEKMPETEIWD